MRTILTIAVVACIAIGAVYAKQQAVAAFERAVSTHQRAVA